MTITSNKISSALAGRNIGYDDQKPEHDGVWLMFFHEYGREHAQPRTFVVMYCVEFVYLRGDLFVVAGMN